MSLLNPYASKTPTIEFYQDTTFSKQWRWRIRFSSDIVAASSEGYATKAAAIENVKKVEQHIKLLREANKLI